MSKAKIGPKVWTHYLLWLNNSMDWGVGLPNGGQFFKLTKDYHQNKPFNKMLGDLPDMPLSVNKMGLFQS